MASHSTYKKLSNEEPRLREIVACYIAVIESAGITEERTITDLMELLLMQHASALFNFAINLAVPPDQELSEPVTRTLEQVSTVEDNLRKAAGNNRTSLLSVVSAAMLENMAALSSRHLGKADKKTLDTKLEAARRSIVEQQVHPELRETVKTALREFDAARLIVTSDQFISREEALARLAKGR